MHSHSGVKSFVIFSQIFEFPKNIIWHMSEETGSFTTHQIVIANEQHFLLPGEHIRFSSGFSTDGKEIPGIGVLQLYGTIPRFQCEYDEGLGIGIIDKYAVHNGEPIPSKFLRNFKPYQVGVALTNVILPVETIVAHLRVGNFHLDGSFTFQIDEFKDDSNQHISYVGVVNNWVDMASGKIVRLYINKDEDVIRNIRCSISGGFSFSLS